MNHGIWYEVCGNNILFHFLQVHCYMICAETVILASDYGNEHVDHFVYIIICQ